MKRYWDSSALIEAYFDRRIEQQSLEADQWTRPHTLSEMFSQFTGGRLGFQLQPDDAAAIIHEVTAAMNFVDLDLKEVRKGLDQAQRHGVRGGNIHDWMHALAAQKAGVQVLLTLNFSDYENLAAGFTIEPP